MKALFYSLLLLIVLPTSLLGQSTKANIRYFSKSDLPFPTDSITGNIAYAGVVDTPGVTADELYERAKSFLFKQFKNAKSVIQVDNKEAGTLGAKGVLSLMVADKKDAVGYHQLMSTIDLKFKNGRYKYEISQFNYGDMTIDYLISNSRIDEAFRNELVQYDAGIREFVADLDRNMRTKEKDW